MQKGYSRVAIHLADLAAAKRFGVAGSVAATRRERLQIF